ncbi:hypothetical protein QTP86_019068 [Hemibagrus guttatus]|nr:hypothetical protein QTP86_019068 [Hemibagrus guttatus]
MEYVIVAEGSNAMASNSHPMLRSDQECESQPPLRPTNVLRSVISSTLSSHTQLYQHASTDSVLQSKVKARSERKAIWKQPSKKKEDKRLVPGFHMSAFSHTGIWGFSSSDEDMEARAEDLAIHTGEESTVTSMGHGEAVFLENLCNAIQDKPAICNAIQDKPWTPPEDFWRIAKEEPLLSNGGDVPGREESKSGVMPRHMALRTDPSIQGEITLSDSAESHPQGCRPCDLGLAEATGSELWHAESLESICSSGSSLSLAERVEINRTILRQMLQKAQKKSSEGQQATINDQRMENTHSRGGLNDSDWDSGISLQDSEQSQRPFVSGAELPLSPRYKQAKQLLECARMKARSNPLKADHTILPVQRDKPELRSWVGAPLQQAPLAGKEQVAVGSGNLSDSSSSDSTGGSRRHRTHGQSPTRVRFQDESEKDAEVRYLERQHRRAGERAQGLLVAKPSLATYIKSQRPEDKYKSRRSQENLRDANIYRPETISQQCNSCGTILDGDFSDSRFVQKQSLPVNGETESRMVPCWVAPTLPNRLVRIEQIKETYIGVMSPAIVESDGTHCRASGSVVNGRGTLQKQKRKSRKRDGSPEMKATDTNGHRTSGSPSISNNTPESNGAVALPPNPYALKSLELKVEGRTSTNLANFEDCVPSAASRGEVPGAQSVPRLPRPVAPPLQSKKSALNLDSPRGQRIMPSQHHHITHIDIVQEGGEQSDLEGIPQGISDPPKTTVISKNSMLKELAGSNSEQGQRTIPAGQHGSQQAGLAQDQIGVEVSASTAKTSVNNGHIEGPIRAEEQMEDRPRPSLSFTPGTEQRESKAQQALRRFISAMGLSARGRLGKGHSSSMEQLGPPLKPRTNSSESSGHPLKKAPSLQNLRLVSPFSQLKKSASVQNLQSPKRKPERSNVYTPGEQPCSPALSRGLQHALSVEDVGSPSAVRSVGRVAQAFPDGTFLLELNRPPDRPFGFLISRGKGRPDSGVYVEDMGDTSTKKLYAGLLGVGDEILEVNGEKVAGLSLELVTQLMVQNDTVSIRVLRHRPPHR